VFSVRGLLPPADVVAMDKAGGGREGDGGGGDDDRKSSKSPFCVQLKCLEKTWTSPSSSQTAVEGGSGTCVRFPQGSEVVFEQADMLLSDVLEVSLYERPLPPPVSSLLLASLPNFFFRPEALGSKKIPLRSLVLDESVTAWFELGPAGSNMEVLLALTLRNVKSDESSVSTHHPLPRNEEETRINRAEQMSVETAPPEDDNGNQREILSAENAGEMSRGNKVETLPASNDPKAASDHNDGEDETATQDLAHHRGEHLLLQVTVIRAFNPKRFIDESHAKASSTVKIRSGDKSLTTSKEVGFEWNQKFYLVRKGVRVLFTASHIVPAYLQMCVSTC
jgi:hypothetical protein